MTLYYKQLLEDMGFEQNCIPVKGDNTASQNIMRNPGKCGIRHMDIKHFFVRDWVLARVTDLVKVPSAENISDIFTKALSIATFRYLRDKAVGHQ